MKRYYKDSRDLCDDMMDHDYFPQGNGWYENEDGDVRVCFDDNMFKKIVVETEYMPSEVVFVKDLIVDSEGSVFTPSNVKIF